MRALSLFLIALSPSLLRGEVEITERLTEMIKALTGRVERLEHEVKKLASAQPPPSTSAPAAPSTEEEDDFKRALATLKEGKTTEARDLLKKFQEKNPDSPQAPLTLYWTAITYLLEKKYAEALVRFEAFREKYPSLKTEETRAKIDEIRKEMGLA